MANVRFFIRSPKAKQPTQIYLVYNLTSNDKIVYPTGIKILPKYWNKDKYRVRNVADFQQKEKINNFLNELQTATDNFILNCKLERRKPSKTELKNFLDNYFNNGNKLTLFAFIENFIKERKTRINSQTSKIVTENTITTYKTTLKHLKEYANETQNKVDFETIDLNFYYDFVEYLQSKDLSLNTIGKYIKTLKIFLNEATARNINKNLAYKSPRFKTLIEESDSIYLNETELKRIYDLDLSKNPRLEKVRDLFIIGAFTGVRFSDLDKINKKNIDNGYLHIKTKKTGKKVVIPVHTYVFEILQKYDYQLPNIITNQKFNEYLKEIGKLAGINETVTKTITKGKFKRTYNKPKYEMITSHTARRSFATNQLKSGLQPAIIMAITGHKTEKSFYKYIKITPEENAKIMRLHWQQTGKYLTVSN